MVQQEEGKNEKKARRKPSSLRCTHVRTSATNLLTHPFTSQLFQRAIRKVVLTCPDSGRLTGTGTFSFLKWVIDKAQVIAALLKQFFFCFLSFSSKRIKTGVFFGLICFVVSKVEWCLMFFADGNLRLAIFFWFFYFFVLARFTFLKVSNGTSGTSGTTSGTEKKGSCAA